eukprot:TRINITY_DN13266_c0_g3_i2.p1 TRINITY_DN13266_c0_g3~~TRINITY_DN13266_c0_g3_i2.p1  ORF type:complete len:392 (+),score=21.32 TRINITY_DN13266_c0_g3_i2:203-1378(+)
MFKRIIWNQFQLQNLRNRSINFQTLIRSFCVQAQHQQQQELIFQQIQQCYKHQQLMEIINNNRTMFDVQHYAHTMRQIPRFANQRTARRIIRELFDTPKQNQIIQKMTGNQLIDCINCMAQAGYVMQITPNSENSENLKLVFNFLEQLEQKIETADVDNLTYLVLSLGNLEFYNETFFNKLLNQLKPQIEKLEPKQISNIFIGFGKLKLYNEEIFKQLVELVTSNIDQFNFKQLANIIQGCEQNRYRDVQFLEIICKRILDMSDIFGQTNGPDQNLVSKVVASLFLLNYVENTNLIYKMVFYLSQAEDPEILSFVLGMIALLNLKFNNQNEIVSKIITSFSKEKFKFKTYENLIYIYVYYDHKQKGQIVDQNYQLPEPLIKIAQHACESEH